MEVDSQVSPAAFALLASIVDGAHVEWNELLRVYGHKNSPVVFVNVQHAFYQVGGHFLQARVRLDEAKVFNPLLLGTYTDLTILIPLSESLNPRLMQLLLIFL